MFISEIDERRFDKIKKNQQLNFGFSAFSAHADEAVAAVPEGDEQLQLRAHPPQD